LQGLPSLHDVPAGAATWVHSPQVLQLSTVQRLPSSQPATLHAANPSWNTILAPAPPTSMSRAMNAPVATIPVPMDNVPLGTRMSAVTTLPVPSDAAGGVAPNDPVVPFCPETSMWTSRAVSVVPDAAPMKLPDEVLKRPATRSWTEPRAWTCAPVPTVRLAMSY
jgi:hypothetical protein